MVGAWAEEVVAKVGAVKPTAAREQRWAMFFLICLCCECSVSPREGVSRVCLIVSHRVEGVSQNRSRANSRVSLSPLYSLESRNSGGAQETPSAPLALPLSRRSGAVRAECAAHAERPNDLRAAQFPGALPHRQCRARHSRNSRTTTQGRKLPPTRIQTARANNRKPGQAQYHTTNTT